MNTNQAPDARSLIQKYVAASARVVFVTSTGVAILGNASGLRKPAAKTQH